MVIVKDRSLNHIYDKEITNALIAVGGTVGQSVEHIELFEKSLPLASDLKRLPLLVGLSGSWELSRTFFNVMDASNVYFMSFQVEVYNQDFEAYNDAIPENRMMQFNAHTFYNPTGGIIAMHFDHITWDYEGCVLLKNRITLRASCGLDTAVTTQDFVLSSIGLNLFLEVDWKETSKNEFKEYLLESIYAET